MYVLLHDSMCTHKCQCMYSYMTVCILLQYMIICIPLCDDAHTPTRLCAYSYMTVRVLLQDNARTPKCSSQLSSMITANYTVIMEGLVLRNLWLMSRVYSAGHPGIRFGSEGPGAAQTEALREEKAPSCWTHPGESRPRLPTWTCSLSFRSMASWPLGIHKAAP